MLRAAGIPFEVVPGVTAGRRRARLRRHPGHPARRGQRRRVRHRPRGPGQAGDGDRLAGARRASPARSSSTWACASCRGSPSSSSPAAAPPTSPRRSSSAARCPASARCARRCATIAERAAEAGVRAPAITRRRRRRRAARRARVVRARARCRAARVAVTRARAQASALAARLRELGAEVVEAPAIRIEPLDAPSCPTSRLRPVAYLAQRRASGCSSAVRDARALAGPRSPRSGPGTARALRERGDRARRRARARGRRGAGRGAARRRRSRRALIARAEEARDVLPDALRERGAEVDVLALYRTVAEPLDDGARAAARGADYVDVHLAPRRCASSPRPAGAARRPAPRLDRPGDERRAARARASSRDVEAAEHTPDGLVDALVADARTRRRAAPEARGSSADSPAREQRRVRRRERRVAARAERGRRTSGARGRG